MQPSYDLVELAKKGVKLKIKKCPRCGGSIYWAYPSVLPNEKELHQDKLKCFTCSRMFYLAKNGKYPKWVQYPNRDEYIDVIVEDTLKSQLNKKGDK